MSRHALTGASIRALTFYRKHRDRINADRRQKRREENAYHCLDCEHPPFTGQGSFLRAAAHAGSEGHRVIQPGRGLKLIVRKRDLETGRLVARRVPASFEQITS